VSHCARSHDRRTYRHPEDAAQGFVWKVIPEPTFEESLRPRARQRIRRRVWDYQRADMSAGVDIGVYQTLLDRAALKTRIYAAWPLPLGNNWRRRACARILAALCCARRSEGFADGSLGSTTACSFSRIETLEYQRHPE